MKFFICAHCGNMITYVKDAGVPVTCCGEPMQEIVPGTVDAAVEKHLPAVTTNGKQVTVSVGSVEHPMTDEHLIEWVALESKEGCQLKHFKAQQKPAVTFCLSDGDSLVATYAYCNLHGLWKA